MNARESREVALSGLGTAPDADLEAQAPPGPLMQGDQERADHYCFASSALDASLEWLHCTCMLVDFNFPRPLACM